MRFAGLNRSISRFSRRNVICTVSLTIGRCVQHQLAFLLDQNYEICLSTALPEYCLVHSNSERSTLRCRLGCHLLQCSIRQTPPFPRHRQKSLGTRYTLHALQGHLLLAVHLTSRLSVHPPAPKWAPLHLLRFRLRILLGDEPPDEGENGYVEQPPAVLLLGNVVGDWRRGGRASHLQGGVEAAIC